MSEVYSKIFHITSLFIVKRFVCVQKKKRLALEIMCDQNKPVSNDITLIVLRNITIEFSIRCQIWGKNSMIPHSSFCATYFRKKYVDNRNKIYDNNQWLLVAGFMGAICYFQKTFLTAFVTILPEFPDTNFCNFRWENNWLFLGLKFALQNLKENSWITQQSFFICSTNSHPTQFMIQANWK